MNPGQYAFNSLIGNVPMPKSVEEAKKQLEVQRTPTADDEAAGFTEEDAQEYASKKNSLESIYGVNSQAARDEIARQKDLRKRARDEAKNVGAGEAFGRGFGSGVLLDIPELFAGDESREKWKAIKEARPFATGIGSLAGSLVPAAALEIATAGAAPTEAGIAAKGGATVKRIYSILGKAGKLPGLSQVKAARAAVAASKLPKYAKISADAAIVGGALSAPHAAARLAAGATGRSGESVGEAAKGAGAEMLFGTAGGAIAAPVFGYFGSKLAGKAPEIGIAKTALGMRKNAHVKMVEKYGKENVDEFYTVFSKYFTDSKGDAGKATQLMLNDATQTIKSMYDDVFALTGGKAPNINEIYAKSVPKTLIKSQYANEFKSNIQTAAQEAIKNKENPYRAISQAVSEMKKDPDFRNAAVAFDNGISTHIDDLVTRAAAGEKQLVPKGVEIDVIKNRYKDAKKAYAQARTTEDFFTRAQAGKEFDESTSAIFAPGGSDTEMKLGAKEIVEKILRDRGGGMAIGAAPGGIETAQDIGAGKWEQIPGDIAKTAIGTGVGYLAGNAMRRGMAKYGIPASRALAQTADSAAIPAIASRGAEKVAQYATDKPMPIDDENAMRPGAPAQAPAIPDESGAVAPPETITPQGGAWFAQSPQAMRAIQSLALRQYRAYQQAGMLPEGYTLDNAVSDFVEQNGEAIANDPDVLARNVLNEEEYKQYQNEQMKKATKESFIDTIDWNQISRFDKRALLPDARMRAEADKIADALFAFDAREGVTATPAKKKMYYNEVMEILQSPTIPIQQRIQLVANKFATPSPMSAKVGIPDGY
jgi:hypothetical protein